MCREKTIRSRLLIFDNRLSIMPTGQDFINTCAQLIDQSYAIAVLTGAGISTNAGIPDFRGPRGFYVTKKYDADKIIDVGFFYDDSKPFE